MEDSSLARERSQRAERRSRVAAGSRSFALGCAARPPRARGADARGIPGSEWRRTLPATSRDRRVSRARADRGARPTGCAPRRCTPRCCTWSPPPIVELNRAVAASMAFGAAAGLAIVELLRSESGAQRVPVLAQRARRFPGQARPLRRGEARGGTGGRADQERPGVSAVLGARGGVRPQRSSDRARVEPRRRSARAGDATSRSSSSLIFNPAAQIRLTTPHQ